MLFRSPQEVCFSISAVNPNSQQVCFALVDSGSFIHAAPAWFAPEVPMGPRDPGIRPRQADGTPLNYYGVKHVPAQTVGGIHIRIRFHVCDVAQSS